MCTFNVMDKYKKDSLLWGNQPQAGFWLWQEAHPQCNSNIKAFTCMAVDEDACKSLYSQELFSVHSGLDGTATANDKRKKISLYLQDRSTYWKQWNNPKALSSSKFSTNLPKWKQNVCAACIKPRCKYTTVTHKTWLLVVHIYFSPYLHRIVLILGFS